MRTSTAPTWPAPQGDLSNYTNPRQEPPDHAIGRSRGGLTTKIRALVDARGRPLVLLTGPGQGGDSPMFLPLMGQLKISRGGLGRPRTRPDRVRGDEAYSSRAIRSHLSQRGIPTRYDKLALTYRGGAVLRAITIWSKELGDTPWSGVAPRSN